MTSLAFLLLVEPAIAVLGTLGLWIFLSIGAVSLFVIFIPTVTWIDKQHKEKEAFYRAETLRRIIEAPGEGAKAAMELLREESRMEQQKKREGTKIGGLVCVAVGAAMVLFMGVQRNPGFLVGLVPGFVGLALLAYVYFLADPTR